jgi:hypothetical protein
MKRRMVLILALMLGVAVLAITNLPSAPAVDAAAADWCDTQSEHCWQEAEQRVFDCQYRGEGTGPDSAYTSCACQGTRHYKRCMDLSGCSGKARAMLLGLEHCFTPQ